MQPPRLFNGADHYLRATTHALELKKEVLQRMSDASLWVDDDGGAAGGEKASVDKTSSFVTQLKKKVGGWGPGKVEEESLLCPRRRP